MSKYNKQYNHYAVDTETTVFQGQTDTKVWSVAMFPFRSAKQLDKMPKPEKKDFIWYSSLEEWFVFLEKEKRNIHCEIHNLKFDGSFIVDYLYNKGYEYDDLGCFRKTRHPKSFHTLVGDMGQWYMLEICLPSGKVISFRDSFKIAPFSLKKLGNDFDIEHKKLEMNYNGEDHSNISAEQLLYILNDVWGLSEILEEFERNGITEMTDASAALARYKESIPKTYFTDAFPNLSQMILTSNNVWNKDMKLDHDYGTYEDVFDKQEKEKPVTNADQYFRKAYHGGYCNADNRYSNFKWSIETVKKAPKEVWEQVYFCYKKHKYIGVTLDVNSLYPSMMHSMSGNVYPVGFPHFTTDVSLLNKFMHKKDRFVFIRFKCSFRIKPNHIPFIQIKNDIRYKGNEMLTTSMPKMKQIDDEVLTDVVEMTMTEVDWKLFNEHYNIYDLEILDGAWFYADSGMFDDYINYWMEIKRNSKGAKRAIAKLMLNSLYGRFAISPITYSKKPYMKDDVLQFELVKQKDKKPLYIPIGCGITAYARAFTIRAGQVNYKYFCYADTDSLHLLCPIEKVKGVKIHPKDLCCWKAETFWDEGYFVRQKTYIEHTTHEDQEEVKPYYNVKCAGMPDSCKKLFIRSVTQSEEERQHQERLYNIIEAGITEEEKDDDIIYQTHKFLKDRRTINDFKIGLVVPGKLMPKRIPGGTILKTDVFTMREKPGVW